MSWLWWAIPAAAGGAWFVVCVRAERRRRCLWCGSLAGRPHARTCRTEARP
jgi:hypothetical protein